MGKKGNSTKNTPQKKSNRSLLFALLFFVIVVPTSVYFINKQSTKKDPSKTGPQENPHKEGTSAYYDWEAARNLDLLAPKMMEVPSPYRFIKGGIDLIEENCWKALDLDTTYTPSWEKLGYVYAFMHGKQSLLVLKSLEDRGLTDQLEAQRAEVATNFLKSNLYYSKALEFGTPDSAAVYYAMAGSSRLQLNYPYVALNLQKAFELKPDNMKYHSELIEAYLYAGEFARAIAENEQFAKKYPEHEFYYRTLGGYYYSKGEEEAGIFYYEKAAEAGSKPEVSMLLEKHFRDLGDTTKANYYIRKVYEARNSYRPIQ